MPISVRLSYDAQSDYGWKDVKGTAVKVCIVSVLLVLTLLFGGSLSFADTPVPSDGFSQVLKAAEEGDAKAQYDVARSYQTGGGVAKDEAKAIYWLAKSAEQGLMEAETSLGSAYDLGMGVPISNRKAVYWWQKAAKQGSEFALRCLGYSYIEGRGVTQNNLYAYVVWHQLPSDDVEVADVLRALRKNLSSEEIAKGDSMTLDDVFLGR